MSSKPEPTDHCQSPDDCPTGGTPGEAGCKGRRSCVNRQNRTTHGLSGEPEYPAWKNMCRRVRSRDYRTYGLGIDPDWSMHPGPFIAYVRAFLLPFQPGDTLERVDNDLGYLPGNVKWADRREQSQNRGHEDAARERGWAGSAPCLCDQRMRQVCPCEPAKAHRAGSAADREETDWPPPGVDTKPGPSVVEVTEGAGAVFLGSLFGEVHRDQHGVAWVLKRSLQYRPGIGPDGIHYVDPMPPIEEPLPDGESSDLDELLGG